jgi:hypothetical protein
MEDFHGVSSGTSQLKTLWSQWDRLDLHGGMLYRKWDSPTKYDPNGALFFCLFGFLAKHLSHWRQ